MIVELEQLKLALIGSDILDNIITMEDIFKLLKLLGWLIIQEKWYDKGNVEVTRLTSPTNKEYTVNGWGNDCSFKELIGILKG